MPNKPPPRPAPRLYLETPDLDDSEAVKLILAQALANADIAAVLVRLKGNNERAHINRVKALAPAVQAAGAALLLDGYANLAARAGADGAHVDGINQLEQAIEALKPDRIVGVGGLYSRHDSMVAGEAGADYLLFGRPDRKGYRPSSADVADQIGWWAELFEPPCVAYAVEVDEIEPFADAGADFVMVGGAIWSDPRGPGAALEDATKALNRGYMSWIGRMP